MYVGKRRALWYDQRSPPMVAIWSAVFRHSHQGNLTRIIVIWINIVEYYANDMSDFQRSSAGQYRLQLWDALNGLPVRCPLSEFLFPYPVRSTSWHPRQHMLAITAVSKTKTFFWWYLLLHCFLFSVFNYDGDGDGDDGNWCGFVSQVGDQAAVMLYCADKERLALSLFFFVLLLLTMYVCVVIVPNVF